jgi:carbon-monoxide dehydrogenase medium subunit
MSSFALVTPPTLARALVERDTHGPDSMVLAGGQSLLILLRQGLANPDPLISLEEVTELREIEQTADGLRIASMATYSSVCGSAAVHQVSPLLARAAGSVGSVHIRNRGTVGGSLCHADPAGDVPVALLALDAEVTLESASAGVRTVAVADFFTENLFETVLGDLEILTGVFLKGPTGQQSMGYRRFSYREGEYPQCLAACLVGWSGGRCTDVRLAVGGAGPSPRRLYEVEAALVGGSLTDTEIDDALDLVQPMLRPMADVRGSVGWKVRVLRHVLHQTLVDARQKDPQ